MREPTIESVEVVLAPDYVRREGLLGWAHVVVDRFWIDGLSIRRTLLNELHVQMPARKAGNGDVHPTVIPLDAALRRAIELAVLAEYRRVRAAGERRIR